MKKERSGTVCIERRQKNIYIYLPIFAKGNIRRINQKLRKMAGIEGESES